VADADLTIVGADSSAELYVDAGTESETVDGAAIGSNAYEDFDLEKVISYDDKKVSELMENKGIIRNKRKILASINNSKIFKAILSECGSFYNYLRTFTKDQTLYETDKTTNALSDAISKDLQKRGMKFAGSTIIYSYLQAIGVIVSHDRDCFLYQEK